jgi:hypothetical protein
VETQLDYGVLARRTLYSSTDSMKPSTDPPFPNVRLLKTHSAILMILLTVRAFAMASAFLYAFQDTGTLREGRSTFYNTEGLGSLGIPDLVTRDYILNS